MSDFNMINLFPASIRKIAVVSPAGLPDADALNNGIRLLRDLGLEVVSGKHILESGEEKYFASDTQGRADDLNRAIQDGSVDLILCSRGGYGSGRILPLIDWSALKQRNLPVLGYSDITALHLGMLAKKAGRPVTSLMATGLKDGLNDPFTAECLRHTLGRLNGGRACKRILLKTQGHAGSCEGKLIVCNLSLLVSLMGSDYLPDFRNTILILEDVGEKPRILDRHLTQLLLSGIPEKVNAVVFGYFTKCGRRGESARVIRRFTESVSVPVYTGLPFGHALPSASFINGTSARIDTDSNLVI